MLAGDMAADRFGDPCQRGIDGSGIERIEFYSKSDIRIAKAERDTFILDRIEAGITLYRASRDAPLNEREREGARP